MNPESYEALWDKEKDIAREETIEETRIRLGSKSEPTISAPTLVPREWEYEIVYDLGWKDDIERFNKLGKQGFELVMIEKNNAYFKRPIPPNFDIK
jgi:hypothetical protein